MEYMRGIILGVFLSFVGVVIYVNTWPVSSCLKIMKWQF